MTAARWPDFLLIVAAGNEGLEESTTIYPAMGDARFGSPMAIAAFPDPTLGFVDNAQLWDPRPPFAANGFHSLAGDAGQIASDLHARGLDTPDSVAPNVVMVGSANNMLASNAVSTHVTPEQLVQSGFSIGIPTSSPSARTYSEFPGSKAPACPRPRSPASRRTSGCSRPELRALPPAITRQAILLNARNGVIDALRDGALGGWRRGAGTALVRNAILDVNGDSAFTEFDIDEYLRHLYVVSNGSSPTPRPRRRPRTSAATI